MEAKHVKAKALFHLLYHLGSQCAVTEKSNSFGIADVWSVTKAGYTHEFEVKVAKSDLMGELKAIQRLKDNSFQYTNFRGKEMKHSYYLGQIAESYTQDIPSRFSFLVTRELVSVAEPFLKGTPYGLYYSTKQSYYLTEVIKPKHLHKEKINEKSMKCLLRKVSMEVQILREKEANTQ